MLGVIPARLASARLPRKPLHNLAGRPLIEWVWRRVVATGLFDEVVVATESDEVAVAARGFGARVELTSPRHPSGTDRIAEVVQRDGYRDFPTVVNIQGDEPFVTALQLERPVALARDQGWDVGTAATVIRDAEELADSAVVKVVVRDDGGALYFSRAAIPFMRDRAPGRADFESGSYLRHLGIYAYRRDALLEWVRLPVARLEETEQLEQLRALAAGLRIGVALVDPVERGVDTPADAARADVRLRKDFSEAADD